jgi:DNA invertase Pin-like site-specific DNA recombinase
MTDKANAPRRLRCAIYTRKSSEEGLEQGFNSLDAQREACAAYVKSQAEEGWKLLPQSYDDGGYSGGNMDRPALEHLLRDIDQRAIDIVVVYKVDRLTRSLSDFARVVERFEARGVSFVSVTQAFNTTSSMGRLTLNVLLSFAQFEREVTGERIRDKIAASKAKGLWMGGNLPLGYDPKGRTLVINPQEAETVRLIFKRYLELGSVHALADDLKARGIHSKAWTTAKGRMIKSVSFARGALYHLLRNRLYRGEIAHKGAVHAGQHPAIVDAELFDAVQASLDANVRARRDRPTEPGGSPLTGLLFYEAGDRMSPTHARGKSGRAYRYYVSTELLKGRSRNRPVAARVPAQAIEDLVRDRMTRFLGQAVPPTWTAIREHIERVTLFERQVVIGLVSAADALDLIPQAESRLMPGDRIELDGDRIKLTIPVKLKHRAGAVRFLDSLGRPAADSRPLNTALVRTIARAHAWRERLAFGDILTVADLAKAEGVTDSHIRQRLRLAFLAPDIIRAIVDDRGSPGLTLDKILKSRFPLEWGAQRRLFGFNKHGPD